MRLIAKRLSYSMRLETTAAPKGVVNVQPTITSIEHPADVSNAENKEITTK